MSPNYYVSTETHPCAVLSTEEDEPIAFFKSEDLANSFAITLNLFGTGEILNIAKLRTVANTGRKLRQLQKELWKRNDHGSPQCEAILQQVNAAYLKFDEALADVGCGQEVRELQLEGSKDANT